MKNNFNSTLQKIRFSKDVAETRSNLEEVSLNSIENFLYKNGLELTTKSTKHLGKVIDQVISKLDLEKEQIKAFAFASPELQAECFLGKNNQAIIRLSSSLIQLLDQEEIKFVVGHELGHLLYRHGAVNTDMSFWESQAKEISADRIGLLACGSIDTAIKAIIKTVSGLNEDYLTFDIDEFIRQMDKFLEVADLGNNLSTHPSMVIRSRALLWFSMTNSFKDFPKDFDERELEKINEKVLKDFNKEKEVIASRNEQYIIENLRLWIIINYIFSKKAYKKDLQEKVLSISNEQTLKKTISLFKNFSPDEIKSRIEIAFKELEDQSLPNYDAQFKRLKSEVKSSLS